MEGSGNKNISFQDLTVTIISNSSGYGAATTLYGNTSVTMIVLIVVFGCIITITILGNVFVIAAILLDKNLQKPSNYLIISLAVADLMVGLVVMPFGAYNEIEKGWYLGSDLCDLSITMDILCCTASILNLVAIAVDRFWSITNINYSLTKTSRPIIIMTTVAWFLALLVALAPQFVWKDPGYLDRIIHQHICIPSLDFSYQIFGNLSTFYIPLIIIIMLYWKIYKKARRSFRWRRALRRGSLKSDTKDDWNRKDSCIRPVALKEMAAPRFTNEGQPTNSNFNKDNDDAIGRRLHDDHSILEKSDVKEVSTIQSTKDNMFKATSCISKLAEQPGNTSSKNPLPDIEGEKEKKLAKTLAIITGAFVTCWLPFFIINFSMTFCPSCYMDPYVSTFTYWLAYINSTINPIIYTTFSPDFRSCFNRMICSICTKKGVTNTVEV